MSTPDAAGSTQARPCALVTNDDGVEGLGLAPLAAAAAPACGEPSAASPTSSCPA